MRRSRSALLLVALLLCAAPRALRAERVLVVDASAPDVPAELRAEAQRLLGAELAARGLQPSLAADPAAAPTRRIAELVSEAEKLAQEFREADALQRLAAADALFRSSAALLHTPEPLVAVLQARAKIADEAGDGAAADEALRRLAVLGPQRALDPGRFPPPVVSRFLRIRAAAASKQGQLRVLSVPAKLPLWIDGARAGTAPLATELPAGEHLVAAGAPGRTSAQLVTIAAGRPAELTLRVEEPRDNTLRERGVAAAADRVVAAALALREGRYRLALRVLAARTIDEPQALRSGAFAAEGLAAAIKELVGQALPALGLAPAVPPPVAPAPAASSSIWRKWWLWTAIGGAIAVAGGVTAAVLLTRDRGVELRVVP